MAMGDTYAQALQARRGKSIDPAILNVGQINSPHGAIDTRLGVDGAASAGGEAHGVPTTMGPGAVDRESTTHLDEHTAPTHEGKMPSAHPNWRSDEHQDEHTQPKGESPTAAPMPASQSPAQGGGDLGEQIGAYVMGHASQNEYDQLKGMKPRSLGERAKMDALKSKYSPTGSGKNG